MPLLEWPTQLAAIRGGDTEYETGNSRGYAGVCKRSLPEIYQILPQLIELWGLNVQTEVESRKNLAKVSGK